MSAIFNPSPAPVEAPRHLAAEPAPPPAGPSRWKGWLGLVVVLVLASAAYLAFRPKPREQVAQAALRTAKVSVGSLDRVLRVTGSTEARNFASITAPMMRGPDSGRNLVLVKLAAAGSIVKPGDLIADIDAQPIKDHVDDLSAQVSQAEGDIKKRQAEQAIEMENLRQTVRSAKADLDKAKLDNQAADIRMPIDKELLQLAIQQAEAQYKELQAVLAITEEKHRSEIRILEYTRDRHTRHRDRHQRDITRFTVHASIGGLVVMQSIWRSGDMGQIQEGDQVWPGQPFMKIVDTNSMQVAARINQSESENVRIGQPARVNFDAFPGMQLTGKVRSVGAMGVGGWNENYYIRTIPVMISIQGADSRVIPDLSASADIILGRKENVIVAPLEAVSVEGGKHVVYVKQGDAIGLREVKLGEHSNTQVEILAGLRAGEEVELGRPAASAR
jgi:HlyD family secretion protein